MGRELGLRLWGFSLVAVGCVAVLTLVAGGCAAGQPEEGSDDDESVAPAAWSDEGGSTRIGCSVVQCGSNATCSDGPDGPACLCIEGFRGNGTTCTDVDECANGTAVCDRNAKCKNTVGSYSCACEPGYTGNGKTCADIDECKTGAAKCDASAECKNISGGYACVCKAGYVLKGAVCAEIDECVPPGINTCHPLATCTNTLGSYTCMCPAGYAGDGKVCTDIDECTPPGVNNCDPMATCTNLPGSFRCACGAGYGGNGITCTPVGLGAPGEVSINAADPATTSTAVTLYLQEPGNLIQNPGAETGDMSGWTLLTSGGSGWGTGAGDPGIQLFGAVHFITSYGWCSRRQLLDLTTLGFTQPDLDLAPLITVRDWYHGQGYGTSTSDRYYMKVELRDAANVVLASYSNGTQATPTTANNTWQMATQAFSGYGVGLRYVYFEDGGRDVENWTGRYGVGMEAASVVVGSVQMRFSNDNLTWSAWQAFAPTASWTLDAVAGTKVVYVQFKTGVSHIWPSVSDSIVLQ